MLSAGENNPHTHMNVPSTSLPKHTSRSSLVSAEKKSRQILFEQSGIPLLPLWVFVACSRVTFTYILTFYAQIF
jgi:hypothetical protein